MGAVKEKEPEQLVGLMPSDYDASDDLDVEEQEKQRIAQLARDMRAGKVRTISLKQLKAELGLDKIPAIPNILDEIQ